MIYLILVCSGLRMWISSEETRWSGIRNSHGVTSSVDRVKSEVYSVKSAVYSVQCVVFSVQCAICSVQFVM